MGSRASAVVPLAVLLIVGSARQAPGAIAIDQIRDINNGGVSFDGVNVYSNPPIGVDETGVFMNNDIVVYSLIGGGGSNGGGLSISLSNGENGIIATQGGANFDIDNLEPPSAVFAAIGNASGKLENGNAIRFSMWMRQDPNAPVVKEPQIEPVVKIELWKEALSGNADFSGALFPGSGDRIWDTDQNAGQPLHMAFGQSQASWVDVNNNGVIATGAPVAVSLVPNEWRRVEATLVVDDDPLDDGLGWKIGSEFFDVGDVEEIRAVMFVGDFAGTALEDGGSFWVDNLMLEVFPTEAAMLATPNPNTAPMEGLAGDYNNNGTVDAADYVAWRDGLGTTFTPAQYDVWRANFGRTAAGTGAASPASAVPEPATWSALLLLTMGSSIYHRVRTRIPEA